MQWRAASPEDASPGVWVETVSSLEDVRPVWPELAVAGKNVFGTWEWLSCWWKHFGRDRQLLITTCRSGGPRGSVVAVLPVYLAAKRPVRVLRMLGHGPTDEMGPVCHPDDRPVAAAALRTLLDQDPLGWDVLVADELPGGVEWTTALRGRLLGRQATPTARFDGRSWAAWLASRSSNLRSSLRRATRRLERLGTIRYRATADTDELDRDLSTLFALHDARWRTSGGSRAFARRRLFHREFAAEALARGWLRLRFLEVDGEAAAGLYNLRFADCESFYQSGRDPRFDRYSPGMLLHAHAIRDALEAGCTEYRFLRGDEAYKRRFADHDDGLQSVGVAANSRGGALLTALARLPQLPRWAVRRVPAPFAWGTGGSPIWGSS
jgi:CelD/BcsL family acetyltransferase involved in cellulose biosynthesis